MSNKKRPWESVWGPSALVLRREAVRQQQARLADRREDWIDRNQYYYEQILNLLRFVIQPDSTVLSVRCESGKFLSGLFASHGVGVDVSEEILARARELHPELQFYCMDPEEKSVEGTFDYILVENLTDMTDPIAALRNLHGNCEPHTRIVLYAYNQLWRPLFALAELLGAKLPRLEPNWLSEGDLKGMLHLTGYEHSQTFYAVLLPKKVPLLAKFVNRYLASLPIFNILSLARIIVARPKDLRGAEKVPSVSVIVPCKNEEGNIEAAVKRIPEMGSGTEILFCDDQSTDGTVDAVHRMQKISPERNIRLIEGPGANKARNVWAGFNAAKSDILMILDADLTVLPEELPYFYKALTEDKGEFINGVRLVFPMQQGAMKYPNLVGNKLFSLMFSFILRTPIKDTLCGTKVFWRTDWLRIQKFVGTWGIEDHWGDYDLLFSAAKLNLRIIDLPVHYQERMFGTTKMTRVFRNGLRMLRILVHAYRIFFVRR